MMKKYIACLFLLFSLFGCGGQNAVTAAPILNESGKTIEQRFAPPPGYKRAQAEQNSFTYYLRTLPLKEQGEYVKYFNGALKPSLNTVYLSVIDMPISKRDLQQCADAVMRLYAEYQYAQKDYANIKFNFVSDAKPRYYKDYVKGDYSYAKFLKYMDYVFAYANTASLLKQLNPVKNFEDMQVGDVLIQQGRPYGHAVIVVDMAVNEQGQKIYMLAQSYMPAQETQILINMQNPGISPWYELKTQTILTPEWTFEPADLRRF